MFKKKYFIQAYTGKVVWFPVININPYKGLFSQHSASYRYADADLFNVFQVYVVYVYLKITHRWLGAIRIRKFDFSTPIGKVRLKQMQLI